MPWQWRLKKICPVRTVLQTNQLFHLLSLSYMFTCGSLTDLSPAPGPDQSVCLLCPPINLSVLCVGQNTSWHGKNMPAYILENIFEEICLWKFLEALDCVLSDYKLFLRYFVWGLPMTIPGRYFICLWKFLEVILSLSCLSLSMCLCCFVQMYVTVVLLMSTVIKVGFISSFHKFPFLFCSYNIFFFLI